MLGLLVTRDMAMFFSVVFVCFLWYFMSLTCFVCSFMCKAKAHVVIEIKNRTESLVTGSRPISV